MRTSLVGAVAALALLPSSARACGGFFCNQSQPVDQSAEEILFDVDQDAGTVTMNVKIEYAGPSTSFAWVVPVPEVPDLKIGTNALFPVLSSLRAQWQLVRDTGTCAMPNYSSSTASTDYGHGGGGVSIVTTGVVGPYETVVLQATDSGELLAWLQDNGFDLPAGLDDALAPYVADGQYFVALRLAKDRDTGDLQPLVLTYPGTAISIPIQLTSVAATEDMGLRVYVLGPHRAVPQSYFHLVLNELAVDWWSGGANIEQVITRAADEAGGHGFFTDYSGLTTGLGVALWNPSWDALPAEIAADSDVASALTSVLASGLPLDDDTLGVLSEAFGLSDTPVDGLDLVDVVNCLQPYSYYGYSYGTVDPSLCYADELAAITFDPAALGDDLEARVLEPRRRVAGELDGAAKITRMTSSVSPVEMTVDPTFVFNPDLPDQPVVRKATETYLCGPDDQDGLFSAPRLLTLADGREVSMPSLQDLSELQLSSIQWLDSKGLTEPVNARIEQMGPSGQPAVVRDNHDLLWDQLKAIEGAGCGCANQNLGASGLLGVGLLALGVRRRRQR